jgi:putative NADH-flavin reductase
MAADAVFLVLGATGASGICLLRELLYREQKTVAYARNASKIPKELKANALLEARLSHMRFIAGSLISRLC